MKRKINLHLIPIVSSVLVGCSTMHTRSIQNQQEGHFFNGQEILCWKSDDTRRPWLVKWAISEDTWNEGRLFVTVHARGNETTADSPQFTAAIYLERDGKFKLLKRLESEFGFFDKPNFAWTKDRTHLLQITEVIYGTGVFTKEHVFTVSRQETEPRLEQVELIPADESFKPFLAKGEGVWKGVTSTFTDDGLFFDFAIWKDGDGNCCPSAGTVHGNYKVERQANGRLLISMDTFKREPIKNSD